MGRAVGVLDGTTTDCCEGCVAGTDEFCDVGCDDG